jgi:iron(III) transport system ATP-binding protein
MERAAHTSDAHGADGGDVVLAADGVRKSFGEVTAVDGVGFEVRAGEILGLLGPSGCGKTTMLRLIAGLERLDEGSIRVGGELLSSPGVHIPPDRRRIAMVFQDYALFPHLDVAGNVEYALGRRPDRARAREVLDLVGLGSEGSRPVHELSGGRGSSFSTSPSRTSTPPCGPGCATRSVRSSAPRARPPCS